MNKIQKFLSLVFFIAIFIVLIYLIQNYGIETLRNKIERTKKIIFLKNIELTLLLESIMTTFGIQESFIGRKYKIKNL